MTTRQNQTRVSEEFIHHLGQAIRIRTVSYDDRSRRDEHAFAEFHQYLKRTFPVTWDALTPEKVADHSLLFTWPGVDRDAPPILLMGHIDVVPVESPETWDVDPFSGATRGEHLYGRGALDDKGAVVAMLAATETLLSEGFEPTRTVMLALGHDEEANGMEGAVRIAALLADRGVRLHLVLDEGGFVSEGTVPMTRRPVALVGVGEKGYLDLEIAASGEGGHSSYPPDTTAVGRVAATVANIEANPMPARVEMQAPFFRAAARAAGWRSRLVLQLVPRLGTLAERALSRERTSNALIRTTLAATMISGGTKANVLPTSARAIVNSRILPGDSTADVLAHVRAQAVDGVEIRAVGGFEPSPVTDIEGHGYVTVAGVIKEVFPDAVVAPWITIGATDARHYERIADHVLRFSPFRVDQDGASGFHGTNERIRLDSGPDAVRFYARIIEAFAS